jgi:hypothetical protein
LLFSLQTPELAVISGLRYPTTRGNCNVSAQGFKVIESSAKPNGNEIGIRGRNDSGGLTFLGFLFRVSGQTPLTSAKCRDGAIQAEKKSNPELKIVNVLEDIHSGALPVSVVNYTNRDRAGKTFYMVRAFVADGDTCGDLEAYSDTPLSASDAALMKS